MVQIRRASLDDAEFIADTYRPFVEDHWASFERIPPNAETMRSRMETAGDQYPWLIAEDSRTLAYAYASPHRSRAAYQTSVDTAIYCAAAARGKGVGKALYSKLLSVLAAQNYVMAYGGIAMPNEASVRLHKAVGFDLVGTYPSVGFKHGAWRDTTWWTKRLSDPQVPPLPIKSVSEVFVID